MTAKKIILLLALLASATAATVANTAFANAPGGAYIQCDGTKSSPVRCTPDGW
jgi:hypothetical protein